MKNIVICVLLIAISMISIYTYSLVLKIESLEINNNKSLDSNGKYLHKFADLRAIVTPLECDTIKVGSYYSADIALGAANLNGSKPIILLADSIDVNRNLLGKIDTFQTNLWHGAIWKSYNKKGQYLLYGKYVFQDNNSLEEYLDFDIKITVE